MKSRATSKSMARIRSVQKKTPPLSTQRAIICVPAKSRPISCPISVTREVICARVINVVCAIRARIIHPGFARQVGVSVAEIGALHGRFTRQSDRFKSAWTFHQFASGAYKNLLDDPLPYVIDFQKIYERLKTISITINSGQMDEANGALAANDVALDHAQRTLIAADDRLTPPVVRRFFERLKRTDDAIIHHLIRFYFYAEATEGDRRDKLDFLFTRIGEDFSADRGEYWSRDSLEFRERIIALVSVLHVSSATPDEVVKLIRAVRSMREEVSRIKRFEELTERHLLRNAR